MTTIKLSRPVAHGDKTIDALDLDLEALTGADIEKCAREASARAGEPIAVLVTDLRMHVEVAAQAAKVPVEVLRLLAAPDFVAVTTRVQAFMLGSV